MYNNKNNIAVFIDASNVHYAKDFIGGRLKLGSIKSYFQKLYNGESVSVFYYSAYPQDGTRSPEKCDGVHKFFVVLQKQFGFVVRKKPLKVIKRDKGGMMEKGNLDVEMTIDIMRHIRDFDVFILFTGDSDFMPVIQEILSEDKKVYVYSTRRAVSIELTTGASGYEDIKNHPQIIETYEKKKTD